MLNTNLSCKLSNVLDNLNITQLRCYNMWRLDNLFIVHIDLQVKSIQSHKSGIKHHYSILHNEQNRTHIILRLYLDNIFVGISLHILIDASSIQLNIMYNNFLYMRYIFVGKVCIYLKFRNNHPNKNLCTHSLQAL